MSNQTRSVVIQALVSCFTEQPTLHFSLGNVYATVMQFNNSADSYQRAVEIKPKYQAAKGTIYGSLLIARVDLEFLIMLESFLY